MKSNFFIPSVVAAGVIAGAVLFTGAGQADTTKTYGPSVSVAAADALAVSTKRRKLMKGQNTPWKKL
ncbi:MAG: hypothetical protein O7C66_05175, partial [Alphaproteobacteria bacterium]|nr:hypothetical protein [Alphaproteobacteria bacterium]